MLIPSIDLMGGKIVQIGHGQTSGQAKDVSLEEFEPWIKKFEKFPLVHVVDLDAAWQLAAEFARPAAAIVKHTNPCGCAEAELLADAYRKALECDPVSAYGGVIGINLAMDEETAREIAKIFIEAVAAPAE